MLAATPELARYSFATAVILGDAGRVRTELGRDPGLCTRVDIWTREGRDGTIGVLRSTFPCRYPQLACRGCDVTAACRWTRLCWAKRRPAGELLMTAPHARQPQVLPRPACTPTAIRAVLAANADSDILQRYDEDLDAAFEQAREQGDVTPLVQTVKRWWFEADAWCDPQAQR
jgi:hypothetical protein